MTTVTLTMPRLGETMEEGTVTAWLVSEGESFARGAPLIEFETDKTAVEFPALGPGRLSKVLVSSGDLVRLGQPIAEIDLMGADDWISTTEDVQQNGVETTETSSSSDAAVSPLDPNKVTNQRSFGRVRATPIARREAARTGVRLETLRGTGRRGRIELADIYQQPKSEKTSNLAESVWGSATGTPLLLVHGFAGDRVTFEQIGMKLGRSGFHVRAVDLPSHGDTAQEASSFVEIVDALCAQLETTRPVHLVGHSLGAAASVCAAQKVGGVSSLTLIAPAGLGQAIDGDFIFGMAKPKSVEAIVNLLPRLSARATTFSVETIDRIYQNLAAGRLGNLAGDIVDDGQQAIDVRTELLELASVMPVRLLLGTEDRILNWRDGIDVSPRIAAHVFSGAGHMPHWDFPEEAASVIGNGIWAG